MSTRNKVYRLVKRVRDGKQEIESATDDIVALLHLETMRRAPADEGLHPFRPNKQFPWFCADCGYPPGEKLKHSDA
jgi:hypothetical protein